MELFKAANQWETRPADERFWTLQEAAEVCRQYYRTSSTHKIPYSELRVEADVSDLYLKAGHDLPDAKLSNYSFGQLCQRGTPTAPAGYLRQLSPTLAAQNLNYGLKRRDEADNANLLIHHGERGEHLLRASVGDMYSRLWNYEVFNRLAELPSGWRVPPARPSGAHDPRARQATSADLLNNKGGFLSVQEGDMISPAGIYASDHDMFVFMVNEDRQIDEGLSRGFFIWNSEVGDKSFGFMSFMYNHVCGNHIVWGAVNVQEVRMRHVGNKMRDKAWGNLAITVKKYADESISEDRAIIESSKSTVLGTTKDMVVAAVLGINKKKKLGLTGEHVNRAYETAERHVDWYGSPNTMWGMVNGLTEASQTSTFADERTKMDQAAGKLLALVA